MTRQETPDILDDVMTCKQESNKTIRQGNKKTIEHGNNKEILLEPVHYAEIKHVNFPGQKEKATFNLSRGVLKKLEQAWRDIRDIRDDRKITKTDIVEQALSDCLRDFKARKQSSKFYLNIVSNKAIEK